MRIGTATGTRQLILVSEAHRSACVHTSPSRFGSPPAQTMPPQEPSSQVVVSAASRRTVNNNFRSISGLVHISKCWVKGGSKVVKHQSVHLGNTQVGGGLVASHCASVDAQRHVAREEARQVLLRSCQPAETFVLSFFFPAFMPHASDVRPHMPGVKPHFH